MKCIREKWHCVNSFKKQEANDTILSKCILVFFFHFGKKTRLISFFVFFVQKKTNGVQPFFWRLGSFFFSCLFTHLGQTRSIGDLQGHLHLNLHNTCKCVDLCCNWTYNEFLRFRGIFGNNSLHSKRCRESQNK